MLFTAKIFRLNNMFKQRIMNVLKINEFSIPFQVNHNPIFLHRQGQKWFEIEWTSISNRVVCVYVFSDMLDNQSAN